MKNKVLKALIVELLIITLVMSDFILLGMNLITYALETVNNTTNNENVKFSAYFITEEGETSQAEYEINSEEMMLYLKVEVDNDGYFDGVITLEDCNFVINQDELPEGVKKIEGNVITLNTVRADEPSQVIAIKIKAKVEENYDYNMLEKNNIINLAGNYYNSTEKVIKIDTDKKVKLNLLVPNDIESTLAGKIITNTTQYNIDNVNKKIVQLQLNSNVINNAYPIKETSFEIQLPENVEFLNVISKGTYATNGIADRKLEENIDYIWEKDNKLLNITINNDVVDGNISWKKEKGDNVIVTLILSNDIEINENEYNVKSKIELYGIEEKILEKQIVYNLLEEANGIINATIENNSEIYKGKIYSKEEREYISETNIEINYSNLIDETVFEETSSYEVDNQIKTANVQYKTTIIDKSEIERILGAEGKITIKNELDEVVTEITADTMSDEEGHIIITYKEGTKTLKFELTKAVETGIITLKHTKVIKPDVYEKEEIKSLDYLVENIKLRYDNVKKEINKKVELKETKTQAELTVVPETLSTATKNEKVKIALTLRTDDERFDLYKNPEIIIKLPEYIKKFEPVSSTPFYMDEFKIDEFKYINASKEIKLKLIGEQTKYSGINNNPYIEIIANIELEEKIASRQDQITLTYKNEKAVVYENNLENGILIVPINIVGHSGLVAFNSIKNYNISTNSAMSNEENIGNLKMNETSTEATSEIVLLNNTGEDLSNVTVIGNLPVDGNIQLGDYNFENNVGATLKNRLNILSGSGNIYYTSNPNATEDLSNPENNWTSNLEEISNPVLYMIVVANMKKGTEVVADYTMNIPANLRNSQDMRTTYVASYELGNTGGTVTAEPVGLETGSVVSTLEAYVGGKKVEDGSNVKAGEVIRYKITVENTGSSDATNIQVTGLIPEGTVYVEPYEDFIYSVPEYTYYLEDTSKENIVFTISNLEGGEITTLEYEVKVNGEVNQRIAKNQITIMYNSDVEVKSNEVANNLEEGNIRVTIKRRTDLSIILKESRFVEYFVIVENLTEEKQSNVELIVNMPSIFTNMSIRTNLNENTNYEVTENGLIIDELEAQDTQVYLVSCILADTIENSIIKETITANAKCNNMNYRSNAYHETIYGIDVNMEMTVTNEEEYLKTDDTIDYEILITNNSKIFEGEHQVELNIPSELTIQKIQIDGVEQEVNNENYFVKRLGLEANSTTRIKITAVVDYDPTRDETKTITTFAKLLYSGIEVERTEDFKHYIEAAVEKQPDVVDPENPDIPQIPTDPEAPIDPETPTDPDTPTDPEKPTDPDTPTNPDTPTDPDETIKKYSISGKAWLDKDKNGAKGIEDEILQGIEVKLLNIKTNEFVRNESKTKDLIVETDEEGYYIFENIEEGKYLVVFEYDTEWYKTTIYEKEGVVESKNSNVISKKLTINGQEKEYATTNELNLNKNIQNIDMGLVFAKRFDLTLEKYITKTIVQTSKETKTYDYKNKEFAKVEIAAKRMLGANILVQYTLKLTNTGDVEAYVNSIVDYMPAGFKFNSELNKDWYETEGNLCTNALEGIAIEPGETKEINLILTKTKTDGNAELINNMAEIKEAYNIYGITDTNSIEGNKNKDENDLGSADFMISIQTGNVISYLVIVIAMLIPIGVAVYIMMKKMLLKEEI